MIIVYAIVLLAAIAVAVWAGWKAARKNAATELTFLNAQLSAKDDDIEQLKQQQQETSSAAEQAGKELAEARTEMAATGRELKLTSENLDKANERLTAYEHERVNLNGRCEALNKEVQMLRQLNSETEKRLNEMMLSTEEKLRNATNEMLKKRSEELEQNNSKAMDGIVRPLETKLKELSQLVQSSRDKSEENTASVKEQIRNMMERTMEIGNEATRLTNALTHQSQYQGSMGEQILGNILDAAGLRKGRDYEEQVTLRSATGASLHNEDTGRTMRPDVILHFPDKKVAIIDSKVSLTAFEKYVNATTEAEKATFLKQHINSMRMQVEDLAAKKYPDYVQKPRETIDFVIMFVPFEGAFQVAMQNDPQLWSDALTKGVCIAGELNLTVILRMIRMAWQQFDRTQNIEEAYKIAGEIVKRIGILHERMEKLHKNIEALGGSYKECDTVLNGNQSITSAAQRLVSYGAKSDKRVPTTEELPLFDEPTPA